MLAGYSLIGFRWLGLQVSQKYIVKLRKKNYKHETCFVLMITFQFPDRITNDDDLLEALDNTPAIPL